LLCPAVASNGSRHPHRVLADAHVAAATPFPEYPDHGPPDLATTGKIE